MSSSKSDLAEAKIAFAVLGPLFSSLTIAKTSAFRSSAPKAGPMKPVLFGVALNIQAAG